MSACQVVDIPDLELQSLVRAYPGIERGLFWLTLVELGIAQRWLVNAGRDAERQIAHLLCEIVARLRAVRCQECETFATAIRQTVIAEITAISLVHVNRVLHALQAADRIKLVKGVITVPDPGRLAAYADFDPGYLHLPDQDEAPQLGLCRLREPSFLDGRNSVAL
ncbi:Crp/Fnr family transcriptional regulator [Methylobacterium sp.]|uniref:Crp/Fnr family transcriptional regulator n=1 Tax=Methylobacterium sp. TaxID=409 RepID=UPI003C738B46